MAVGGIAPPSVFPHRLPLRCSTLHHHASHRLSRQLSVCFSIGQVWLILAAVGGIAPPSAIPHRLPVLHSTPPGLALQVSCMQRSICSGGQYRSAFGHSSPLPLCYTLSAPCFSSLRYGVLHPIRASGWYRSTFGLSSLAPFAVRHFTKPCLAPPCAVLRASGWYRSTFGLSSLAPFATHLRTSLRSAFQDRVSWRWRVSLPLCS